MRLCEQDKWENSSYMKVKWQNQKVKEICKSKYGHELTVKIRRNPLESLVSSNEIWSLVPLRTEELEFISSTATSVSIFATLPMVELKDKIAPILMMLGLAKRFLMTPVLEGKLVQRISNEEARLCPCYVVLQNQIA